MGNPTILKKTNKNQQNLRENQKTCFLRFQTHPWILVWSCFVFGFPEVFFGFLKTLGKTKHTKETKRKQKPSGKPQIHKKTNKNQTNLRENQTTKFLKVSDPPLDMGLVLFGLLVVPKVFRKPKKKSGKPKIQKKTKKT